jgi:hypothetical protein
MWKMKVMGNKFIFDKELEIGDIVCALDMRVFKWSAVIPLVMARVVFSLDIEGIRMHVLETLEEKEKFACPRKLIAYSLDKSDSRYKKFEEE